MDIHHVQSAVSVLTLSVFSFWDIKHKYLYFGPVMVYLVLGAIIGLFNYPFPLYLLSILPGALTLLLSYVSGQKIGYGDGFTILALGIWVGFFRSVFAFIIGILLIGIASIVYIFVSKVRKQMVDYDMKLPFIPFLLVGLVVSIFV